MILNENFLVYPYSADLELVLMTRGLVHLEQIIKVLATAGYKTRLLTICEAN